MYCSSCGAAVMQGLSYCNNCGARLNESKGEGPAAKEAELFSDSLVWAMVAVFIVGLGCTIGLMAMMKELLKLDNSIIVAAGCAIFFLMLVIESVLIWLLLSRRSRGVAKESGASGQLKEQVTKELDAAQALALPEPLPSVTEHTTRTLEPIYSKQKSE
jgi:predicted amidophosphoribosyltransferase